MNPFDICIAYVSWDASGKHRPVLLIEKNDDYAEAFRITSQYEGKSKAIQAQYYKIDDWQQAGLSKESYIDTIASVEVPITQLRQPLGN